MTIREEVYDTLLGFIDKLHIGRSKRESRRCVGARVHRDTPHLDRYTYSRAIDYSTRGLPALELFAERGYARRKDDCNPGRCFVG